MYVRLQAVLHSHLKTVTSFYKGTVQIPKSLLNANLLIEEGSMLVALKPIYFFGNWNR